MALNLSLISDSELLRIETEVEKECERRKTTLKMVLHGGNTYSRTKKTHYIPKEVAAEMLETEGPVKSSDPIYIKAVENAMAKEWKPSKNVLRLVSIELPLGQSAKIRVTTSNTK